MKYLIVISLILSFSKVKSQTKTDSLQAQKKALLSQLGNIDQAIKEDEINKVLKSNLSFKQVEIIAKYSVDVRDTPVLLNNNIVWKINEGDTIKVVGFKNDFLSVKHKDKIGYSYFINFESFDEIKAQMDTLRLIENAEKEKEEIKKQKINVLTEELEALESEKKDLEEKLRWYELFQKFKKLGSPLILTNASVSFNSIGNPEANISVVNISNKIIDAFTVEILCYDNFNKPVNHYLYHKNVFKGISQQEINLNESLDCLWDLFGHDNTTKIRVILKKVHFKNNSTWTATTNNIFSKSG